MMTIIIIIGMGISNNNNNGEFILEQDFIWRLGF